MGYTTEFEGQVNIEPPLNEQEIEFLTKFSESRRMDRKSGPYNVEGKDDWNASRDGGDIRDYNQPPKGQPGLWCQWVPTSDGTALEWDGNEKFYDSVEWMQYIIDHFLKPGALAKDALPFLQANHTVNGVINAQGEDSGDIWRLVVKNNDVDEQKATICYEGDE